MDLKERLEYIRVYNKKKPNISEYEFAKTLNTYPTKFAEIRSGKVKTLSQDIALEISKIYEVEFLWVLTGEGAIFTKDKYCQNYDAEKLKNIIIMLENYIEKYNVNIPSTKKADIIILLYQLYADYHVLSDDIISQMCEIAKWLFFKTNNILKSS